MELTFGLQMLLSGLMEMEMDLVIILAEPMATNALEFQVHLPKIEMDVLTLMEMVGEIIRIQQQHRLMHSRTNQVNGSIPIPMDLTHGSNN